MIFVEPGTLPKPLPIGRAGRLIFGVGALFYFAWLIIHQGALVGSNVPELGWWVGVFFAFYYLPDLFIVGLLRPRGRWPQAAGLVIALSLLVVDFAAYGTGWAPPLGWGVYIFTALFFGLIGVAFLFAAVLGVPGLRVQWIAPRRGADTETPRQRASLKGAIRPSG